MTDDEVTRNLKAMDELDFKGWNGADWHGLFAHFHTDDVLVDVHGQPATHGIGEHIAAMKALVQVSGEPRADNVPSDQVWIRRVDVRSGRIRRRRPDGDRGKMARSSDRRGIHVDVVIFTSS